HGEEIIQSSGRLLVGNLMKGDQSQSFRAERRRILKSHIVLQLGDFAVTLVPLLAGHLACAAADALGDVNQRGFDGCICRPLAHAVFLLLLLGTAAGNSLALTTFTRQALVS